MKKILRLSFLLSYTSILFFSCRKEEIAEVDFEAGLNGTTFSLSDSLRFKFSGNPDVINFYSGQEGNNYEFRNRTARNDGSFRYSFQTRVDNAAGFAAIAAGNLRIMASTNFTANYSTNSNTAIAASMDSALVNAATWVDITNRFFLPATGTAGTFYPSNEVNLSDLITDPAIPVFIAYKYVGPSTGALGTNGITLGSMVLANYFPDGTSVNYPIAPGGSNSTVWKIIRAANAANAWSTTTTQIRFTSTATTAYSEDWIISNSYYPNQVFPDKGICIKNVAENRRESFSYKFTKAGTYNVVLVASNNREFGSKEIVREFKVTVTP
jgi:hypothetical protein